MFTMPLILFFTDLLLLLLLLLQYQEEVIDHLWDSYSTLKTLLEQKDEVINQLYTQISDMQESSALASNGALPLKIPAATVRVRNTPSKSTKEAKAEQEEAAVQKGKESDKEDEKEKVRAVSFVSHLILKYPILFRMCRQHTI